MDRPVPDRFIEVPGGRGLLGTRTPLLGIDGEAPLREVKVPPFAIDPYAVTNDWFAAFIADTGYVTEAERFGWSFVFHGLLREDAGPTQGVIGAVWWRNVPGACWRAPEGPGSDLTGRGNHPVVQVSLNDAKTFARWAGARLPTEAEWEHAARGGRGDVRYPWGDRDPEEHGFLPCNIWQGDFPERNTAADGWLGTCPVDAFEPNAYGLFNMCGNVWEWCHQPMRIRSTKKLLRAADADAARRGLMLTKGGSYLCHDTYCHRYRIAARTGNTPDSATGHIGFRVIYDLPLSERARTDRTGWGLEVEAGCRLQQTCNFDERYDPDLIFDEAKSFGDGDTLKPKDFARLQELGLCFPVATCGVGIEEGVHRE